METQMKQLLEDWASKRASLLKNWSCSLVWFCFCLVAKSPYETCDVDQARLDLVAGLCLPLLPQDQGHRSVSQAQLNGVALLCSAAGLKCRALTSPALTV